MSNFWKQVVATLLLLFLAGAMIHQAFGATRESGEHKVVIQVSSGDEATQGLALNNAANLQKEYGLDNVVIEVVAYGPGLTLLTADNGNAQRVQSLAVQGIAFSACGNTIKAIEKKTGETPELTAGVKVVPAGVGRIMELEEQGYSYVRP